MTGDHLGSDVNPFEEATSGIEAIGTNTRAMFNQQNTDQRRICLSNEITFGELFLTANSKIAEEIGDRQKGNLNLDKICCLMQEAIVSVFRK